MSTDFSLPASTGTGFKPEHFAARLAEPAFGFIEVHAENYMGEGGAAHAQLARLRCDHALSLHGVGLSIGSDDRQLDRDHLRRLRRLCDRYQPDSFSEHLAWSSHGGIFLNDLLPLPYTEATLTRVIAHVSQAQEALGRRLLLENPATYLSFGDSTIPEPDFLAAVAARSGCGLLLDVNNIVVACTNRGDDPQAWLDALPLGAVGEIHLAGHHATQDALGAPLLIDDHGSPVTDAVWALYERVIARTGPLPTLIEWDTDLPDWSVLKAQAEQAQAILARATGAAKAA
jgi:uncharacterized protein (UPF0276 family)